MFLANIKSNFFCRRNPMGIYNTFERYGLVTKLLHWMLVLVIFYQLAIGFLGQYIHSKSLSRFLMMLHKSFGVAMVFISLFFIVWGLINKKPACPPGMSVALKCFAKCVHLGLYASLLVMSLSGWFMSTAFGYPPKLFNLVTVSAPWVVLSKTQARFFHNIHHMAAWALLILLSIHLLAVLKHWLIDKDGVVLRMMRL